MLGEYYESYGNIRRRDCADVLTGYLTESAESLDECELGNSEECVKTDAAFYEGVKYAEVDYLESFVSCCGADYGEYCRYSIACEDTDDERDETRHLFTEGGAEYRYEESYETAEYAEVYARRACAAGLEIAYGIACEGKTDYSDCRTDYDCRHELVEPFNADYLNEDSDYYINKTCEYRADYQSEIADFYAYSSCESRRH